MSDVTSNDNMAEIKITITDSNASYESTLPPHEIIFWLDLMKFMILNNLVSSNPPEITPPHEEVV